MLVTPEFVKDIVGLINYVDGNGTVSRTTTEGTLIGIRLATSRKEYKNIFSINLRGDGWMVSLTARKSMPKGDTPISQKEFFTLENRDLWLYNCCILSGEKLEDDWAIIKLALQ